MSLRDCIQRGIDDGEIDRARGEYAQEMWRDLSDRYANSHPRHVAEGLAAEDVRNALRKEFGQKRHEYLARMADIRKAEGDVARAQDLAHLPIQTMWSKVDSPDRFITDAESLHRALVERVNWRLQKLLQEHHRDLLGRPKKPKKLENVLREMKGENTGDIAARETAQSVADTLEELRHLYNEAGGSIPKRENWGITHTHNRRALMRAGFDQWFEGTRARLDWSKIEDHMTGRPFAEAGAEPPLDVQRRFLTDTYNNITTDGASTMTPQYGVPHGSALYRRRNDPRVLEFKSADDWIAYNREFGTGNLLSSIIGHAHMMARDVALMGFCLTTDRWTLSAGGSRWMDFAYPANADIALRGDGKDLTVFKIKDGLISERGRFTFTFGFVAAYVANDPRTVHFSDFTIDQNGSNNPLGVGDGSFQFEQAHAVYMHTHDKSNFVNMHIKDKVGGGIVFASGVCNAFVCENITESDFSENFGQRADIESQGRAEFLSVSACRCRYIQVETDTPGALQEVRMVNSKFDVIDFSGQSNRDNFYVYMTNCESTKGTLLSDGHFEIVNCSLKENTNNFKWVRWMPGSKVIGGTIKLAVDASGNVSYVRPRRASGTERYEYTFMGVTFLIDSDNPAFVPNNTAYAIGGNQEVNTLGDDWRVIVDGCRFDSRLSGIAENYRSFHLEVRNSELSCSGLYAFFAGAAGVVGETSALSIVNCDLSNMEAGSLVFIPNVDASNNFRFTCGGVYPVGKWSLGFGALGSTNGRNRMEAAAEYRVAARLIGDALPAAPFGLKGLSISRATPTASEWYEQVSKTKDDWAIITTVPA